MIAEEAYVLSKSFTKKSLDGQGALKGAPCTIKNITEVDGGQKVTFEWTGTSGTKQTSEMTVKNGVSVTGISDKGNGVFTLLLSDGSESDPIQCVKGEDGFSPTATVEKVGKVATITITDKNGTTTATIKDGEGSEGGEANVIDSISVNGVNVPVDVNKNVDITVPSIDGLAKTEDIPTKVSELTNDSGYLTEHQDISGKVDKVEGKSLISDTEIARLATVDNYDDTDIKAEIAKKADTTSIPRKVSVLENDSKYQTESDVTTTLSDYATKTYVGEQIANAEHLKREIVTVLPSDTEASDNIIYMLKVESTVGNDKYQEYMKIDGTVQMVGDTSVDLTDYAKTVDIPTTVAELTDSADYAKTSDVNNSISTLQTDKANASDLTAHTDDVDIHVTADNKTLWNTVEDKVDKTSIVTALDDTVTDEQVASALLAKTELDKKVDKTSIATTFSSESTNDEVVGAKLAYDELKKAELATKEQFATASGESISVNDSVDGKLVELGVKGNSFQQTYSGKNLLVYPYTNTTKVDSGVTFTDNGDGSITINGTNTTDNWLYFWLFGSTTSEESKRENLYGKQLVVSGLKNVVGSIKLESYYKTTDGKEYWVKPTGNDNDYFTITYPSKSEVALMNLAFVIYPNGVVNNVTVKPMIRLATETDSSYEPYVGGIPSPNPSYPQEIKSVVNPVVKVCGKNLLNPGYRCSGQERYGISVVENSDGSITINGTTTSVAYINFKFGTSLSNYHKVKKGKYTLSVNGESLSNIAVCVDLYNTSYKSVLGSGYITFETDVDYVNALYLKIPEGITFNNNKYYPQLEIGDTATPYEPYTEQTAALPYTLNAIPVESGGNVTIDGQEYIADYVDFEKKKLVRRVKKKDLGEFDWNYVYNVNPKLKYFDTTILDSFKPTESHPIGEGFCDSYSVEKNNIPQSDLANNKVAIGWLNTSSTRCCLEIRDDNYTNALDFKNAVKGRYVYYQLATPTTIDLTDEQVQAFKELSTYYPTTNVFVTSDQLNGYAEIKYPTTDVSGLASRNESRIAELAKDTDGKFDDVNESLGVVGKCKNLLNPTLQTTTQNGVTCTNNGDGTYTLNGTASANTFININTKISVETGKTYNLIGFNGDINIGDERGIQYVVRDAYDADIQFTRVGGVFVPNVSNILIYVFVWKGITLNNVLFKPMLTTDLNATYDDFVPYTGEGETLAHDVAGIKNDLGGTDISAIGDGTITNAISMMSSKLGGLTFSASGTTLSITDGTNTWTLEANS